MAFKKGHIVSDNCKRRSSEVHKGKPSGSAGKHWKLSEETKKKMRKPKSDATKEKFRKFQTGQKRSIEQRLNMSGENCHFWKGGICKDINKYMINYRRNQKEKLAGRKMPEQCEICGVLTSDLKRGLCYDHDHKTGKFRGWICSRCNTSIGLAKENTEILLSMIDYLKKNRTKSVNGLD